MEYEILKPISRKSVYDALPGSPPGAKCAEALKRYEAFDAVFSGLVTFTYELPLYEYSTLSCWLQEHPHDLQWLIDKGFIVGVVKPTFVPFNLPIETEEEAYQLYYVLRNCLPSSAIYQRVNAIYSPTATEEPNAIS